VLWRERLARRTLPSKVLCLYLFFDSAAMLREEVSAGYAAVDVKSRERSDTPGAAVANSEDRPSPCINSEPVFYLVPTLLWMGDC